MSRLFFALSPDNETKDFIVHAQKKLNLSGRLIKLENIHLTLLFMGKISTIQRKKIIGLAKEIQISEFELLLNQTGYFKNSQVNWVGLQSIPKSLIHLHEKLHFAATHSHILIKSQAYKPHVTLARKSRPIPKQLISNIKWQAKEFVLLESFDTANGVVYEPVESFPLCH